MQMVCVYIQLKWKPTFSVSTFYNLHVNIQLNPKYFKVPTKQNTHFVAALHKITVSFVLRG
jgi:hypothetical protein